MPTMPAQMASLRRVGWINKHDRHPSSLGLVRDKLPQLEERPTVVVVALRLADLRTLPDTLQVFQRNLSLGCPGCLHDLLTDGVVDRPHVACLSAREPFQKPLRFLRAFALERTPDFGIVRTEPLNLRGFVGAGIGIDRDTPSAKIDAQRAGWCVGRRNGAFELDMQEERAITTLDERGTGRCLALEPPLLVVAKHGLKPCACVQERQAQGPVPFPEAENALIVVHRGGLKRRVDFALDLQSGTDMRNGANDQVGRQAKAASDLRIAGMLHLDLVTRMDLAHHIGNEVAGVCKGDKRGVEFGALLWGWRKFAGYRSYAVHRGHYITVNVTYNFGSSPGKALPPLPINRRGIHGLKPNFW